MTLAQLFAALAVGLVVWFIAHPYIPTEMARLYKIANAVSSFFARS
ncbi:hypothetical protein [Caballeronia sp. M23-90]